MAKRHLTAAFVANAKPAPGAAQTDYFDTALPGFGLRVGKTRKTWFCMARVLKAGAWKLARVTLGTAGELTLSDARKAARDAIERAQQGKDPAGVRGERRAALEARSRDTFASVRGDFLKRYVGRENRRPAPRTLAEIERALSCDVLAAWEARPIADIGERDIIEALDKLVERGAETMANRVARLSTAAVQVGKVSPHRHQQPRGGCRKPGAETSRDRVLSIGELAAIWHATDPADLYGGIVRALMLTGQRRLEIAAMRWDEVLEDYALATDSQGTPTETCTALVLPPERTKNHRRHVLPLSAPVLAIIEARRAEQAATGQALTLRVCH